MKNLTMMRTYCLLAPIPLYHKINYYDSCPCSQLKNHNDQNLFCKATVSCKRVSGQSKLPSGMRAAVIIIHYYIIFGCGLPVQIEHFLLYLNRMYYANTIEHAQCK